MDLFTAGALFYGLIVGHTLHWLMQPNVVIEKPWDWWRWNFFAGLCALAWPLFFVALGCLSLWVSIKKD